MIIPRMDHSLKLTQKAVPAIALLARGGAILPPSTSTVLVDLCASAAPIASMLIFFAVRIYTYFRLRFFSSPCM